MISYENIFIVLCAFIAGLSYWLVNRVVLLRKGAEEMKAKEMATAIQDLCNDFGVNSSVLAKPRRLKCVYCDCISSKESGTCEHCGAPLVEDEY